MLLISTLLLLTTSIRVCDSNWVVKLIWLFAYIKGNLHSFESKGIAIIGSKSLQAYSAICTIQHFHPYLVVLLTLRFTASEKKPHQRTTDMLIQAKYFESHSISQHIYLICSNDFYLIKNYSSTIYSMENRSRDLHHSERKF